MSDAVEIWEHPEAKEIYMVVGWRQWADAGAMSSGLPQYLVQQMGAHRIGKIRPDGFYIFQIPGTHDLVRPIVKFEEGYPAKLEAQHNEIFYAGDDKTGVVIFLGDEPHLDIERYITAVLHIAKTLNVRRIVSTAGVYSTELPYDKERMISASYSHKHLREELNQYALNFSDYHGGASIGSYLCRRAGDNDIEYVGLYALVPAYDFSNMMQIDKTIRIENDFMAWQGAMRRINHMFKLGFDFTDLEAKTESLLRAIEAKVDEIDSDSPQLGIRSYITQLSEQFDEVIFDPLGDVWEDEIRKLFDDSEAAD